MAKKIKLVMLIDDDTTMNTAVSKIVENSEMVEEVITANSGNEALKVLSKRMEMGFKLPDLTFLDINMPNMNGWDFLDLYVSKFGKGSNHEVILLTSSTQTKDLIKVAVHPHVDEYVNKPVSAVEIEQLLHQHLSKLQVAR